VLELKAAELRSVGPHRELLLGMEFRFQVRVLCADLDYEDGSAGRSKLAVRVRKGVPV